MLNIRFAMFNVRFDSCSRCISKVLEIPSQIEDPGKDFAILGAVVLFSLIIQNCQYTSGWKNHNI